MSAAGTINAIDPGTHMMAPAVAWSLSGSRPNSEARSHKSDKRLGHRKRETLPAPCSEDQPGEDKESSPSAASTGDLAMAERHATRKEMPSLRSRNAQTCARRGNRERIRKNPGSAKDVTQDEERQQTAGCISRCKKLFSNGPLKKRPQHPTGKAARQTAEQRQLRRAEKKQRRGNHRQQQMLNHVRGQYGTTQRRQAARPARNRSPLARPGNTRASTGDTAREPDAAAFASPENRSAPSPASRRRAQEERPTKQGRLFLHSRNPTLTQGGRSAGKSISTIRATPQPSPCFS